MTKFRYVPNKTRTKSLPLDEAQFDAIATDMHLAYICDEARKAKQAGDADEYDKQKGELPLAFWIGYNKDGKRAAEKQLRSGRNGKNGRRTLTRSMKTQTQPSSSCTNRSFRMIPKHSKTFRN